MANETLTNIFSDIADAVRAKGVTGQMTPLQMPQKIADIPSGGEGGAAEWQVVNFIDYDGTNLYSYTGVPDELPPAPDRTSKGLQFQEWNYTLAQITSQTGDIGKCTVGATYTTTDGKTHIKITIQDGHYSEIPLIFSQTVSGGVEVDWGDDSGPDTYYSTGNQYISHQYTPPSYPASYDITFKVNSGTMSFSDQIMGKVSTDTSTDPTSAWNSMIKEVNIGNGVTRIESNVFKGCSNLRIVTIPNSVTYIGFNAFENCSSLASITIPSGVENLYDSTFSACYSLVSISIPSSVWQMGQNLFQNCYSLASIAKLYQNGPSKWQFFGCMSLDSVTIPPYAVDIGEYAFSACYSLTSVTMPEWGTNIEIGNSAFSYCRSLASITMTSGVTSIGTYAFNSCYGLVKLDCSECSQVPTLADANALENTNTDLKIVVPDELYDDWIVATNWSTYESQIVKASEYTPAS